jgi:hypothetical protein
MFAVGPEGSRVPLCLECNLKLVQMTTMQNDMLEHQMNFLMDEMDMVTGIRTGPRFPERRIVQMGRVTLNNIRVDRSTIGVLNTGTIQSVDNAVTALHQSGDRDLSRAILELTQAVLASTEAERDMKNNIVEVLSILSTEATAPRERRRSKAMWPLLEQLATWVSMVPGLIEVWHRVEPVLRSAFPS